MWWPHSSHAHLSVPSTVKSSLFTHAHCSPPCLAARLHRCCPNHSRYINNGWTFSRQTSYAVDTMEYYAAIRKDEIVNAICYDMNGSWDYHAKQNMSSEKSQESCDLTHTWNIKLRQTKPHRNRQQYGSYQRKKRMRVVEKVKGVKYMVIQEIWLWWWTYNAMYRGGRQ